MKYQLRNNFIGIFLQTRYCFFFNSSSSVMKLFNKRSCFGTRTTLFAMKWENEMIYVSKKWHKQRIEMWNAITKWPSIKMVVKVKYKQYNVLSRMSRVPWNHLRKKYRCWRWCQKQIFTFLRQNFGIGILAGRFGRQ